MARLPDTRFSLLAKLAQPADVEAWSEFVTIYEQAIYRYARSHGLQEPDAWEVVQQVLLAVHQKIGDWRPNGQTGAFRCWLMRTAHRVCLRGLREARKLDRAIGGQENEDAINRTPSQSTTTTEDQDWQRWAFCWAASIVEQEIEGQTWKAFWMTAVEERSPTEVAGALGMKVGSVYTAKCRVIARIREQVQSLSRIGS